MKVSGELSIHIQFNLLKKKKKKLTDRKAKPSLPSPRFFIISLSSVQTTNSCVLSYSSSFLLFRGRTEELSLCHDQALCLILVRQFSLFLRSTAKAGFIISNYKHKK